MLVTFGDLARDQRAKVIVRQQFPADLASAESGATAGGVLTDLAWPQR